MYIPRIFIKYISSRRYPKVYVRLRLAAGSPRLYLRELRRYSMVYDRVAVPLCPCARWTREPENPREMGRWRRKWGSACTSFVVFGTSSYTRFRQLLHRRSDPRSPCPEPLLRRCITDPAYVYACNGSMHRAERRHRPIVILLWGHNARHSHRRLGSEIGPRPFFSFSQEQPRSTP